MSNNVLRAVMIGDSGNGKTETILSFVDPEQRRMIPATGEMQTTRYTAEYRLSGQACLSFRFALWTKDEFCELRCGNFMKKAINAIKNHNKPGQAIESLGELINFSSELWEDNFFKFEEFSCGKDMKEAFLEIFKIENIKALLASEKCGIEQLDDNRNIIFISRELEEVLLNELRKAFSDPMKDSEGADIDEWEIESEQESDTKGKGNFIKCVKYFYKNVYDVICKEFVAELEKQGIQVEKERERVFFRIPAERFTKEQFTEEKFNFLKRILRVCTGETSFSSLISKMEMDAKLAEDFKNILKVYEKEGLELLDTYGLDHSSNDAGDDAAIQNRLANILNAEQKDIDCVLLIRTLKTKSPTALERYVPMLVRVAPQLPPYVLFTALDLGRKKLEYEKCRLSDSLQEVSAELKLIYSKEQSAEIDAVVALRTEAIEKYSDGYCARIGSAYDPNYQHLYEPWAKPDELKEEDEFASSPMLNEKFVEPLREKNLDTFEKIVRAVCYGLHRGGDYINIKLLIEKKDELLDLSKLFEELDGKGFGSVAPRTKWAIGNRLRNTEYGFEGVRWDLTWRTIIFNALTSYFNNHYFDKVLPILSTSDSVTASTAKAFEDLPDIIRRHVGNYVGDQREIGQLLYQFKESVIRDDFVAYYGGRNSTEYLEDVYDFRTITGSDDFSSRLKEVLDHIFLNEFIPRCRKHNARVFATKISPLQEENPDQTEQKNLDMYFSIYEPEGFSNADRCLFESMVVDQQQREYRRKHPI